MEHLLTFDEFAQLAIASGYFTAAFLLWLWRDRFGPLRVFGWLVLPAAILSGGFYVVLVAIDELAILGQVTWMSRVSHAFWIASLFVAAFVGRSVGEDA